MTSSPCLTLVSPTIRPWAPWPLRWLASVKLAVILIVILAAVAAVATFVEVAKGRDYVLWYVYHSPWFAGLLGVLAANVLAAAIVRFPWKVGQIPFLATHVGLLVLLAGAAWTFRDGIEGRLLLVEGEAADRMELNDRCQFRAEWTGGRGRPDRWPAAFAFSPGPIDRREGEPLDLGQGSGVHLRLTRFYRHAERHEDWVADDSGKAPPALKLAVADAGGAADEGRWLVANPFRPEVTMDRMRLEFQRAGGLDAGGLPQASGRRHGSSRRPLPALCPAASGGSRWARTSARRSTWTMARSRSKSSSTCRTPKWMPTTTWVPRATPAGQPALGIANPRTRAKRTHPETRLRPLPVPELRGTSRADLPREILLSPPGLQGPGRSRVSGNARRQALLSRRHRGQVSVAGRGPRGRRVGTSGGGPRGADGLLPHARRQVTFQPAAGNEEEVARSPATACLEVTAGGETHEVWLQRNDKEYGTRRLATPEGPLAIAFGNVYYPLGFSLRLEEFEHSLNPGGMGHASFASRVRLIEKSRQTDEQREIWTNHPLAYGKFVFYQSGFREEPGAKPASVFMVAHDPGRGLKYLGSLMTCVGTLLVLCRKAKVFGPYRTATAACELASNGTGGSASPSGAGVESIALLLAVLSLSAAGMAARTSEGGMDWKAWRWLPVQDCGRRKPLDTLATETMGRIGNRTSFTEPETGRALDATGLYLSMLFDYEGEDADKWDREPLILVKSLELQGPGYGRRPDSHLGPRPARGENRGPACCMGS